MEAVSLIAVELKIFVNVIFSDLLDVRRSVDSAKKEEDSLIEKMVDEALVPPKPFKK